MTQTVPLIMKNLSNMFVCELVVLDNVNFYQHILKDLLFLLKTLWRSIALEWLALCARVFPALYEHCTKVVRYVQFDFVSWY